MQLDSNPFKAFENMPGFLENKAVVRALRYLASGQLPPGFKWKTWSDACDEEAAAEEAAAMAASATSTGAFEDAADTDTWRSDPAAERAFMGGLGAFMSARGTPIKRTPSLAFRDLDLYRLYTVVAAHGGAAAVKGVEGWRQVYASLLNLDEDELPASADKTMRSAYEKYLLQYELHLAEEGSLPPAVPASPRAAEPAPAPEVTEDDAAFAYGVAMQARCKYEDGKRYAVSIVARELRAPTPGAPLQPAYKVHYQNWARRYDHWVFESDLLPFDAAGGSRKRSARGRGTGAGAASPPAKAPRGSADGTAPATPSTPAAAPATQSGSKSRSAKGRGPRSARSTGRAAASSEGEGPSSAEAGEATDGAALPPPAASLEEAPDAAISDEQLARSLALAEAFQAGRRRATRKSWSKAGGLLQKASGTKDEPPAAMLESAVAAAVAPEPPSPTVRTPTVRTPAVTPPSEPRALAAALFAKAEASAAKAMAKERREAAERERSESRRSTRVADSEDEEGEEDCDPEIGVPGHLCYAPGGCWGDNCYVPSCCTTGIGPRLGRPHYLDALSEVNGGSRAKIEFLRSQYTKHTRAVRTLQSVQRRLAKQGKV